MLYFWNPDDSLIPNMMIDTSPWSSCSRRSPCSSHTFSSTGPSVSSFRDFSNKNQCVIMGMFFMIWGAQHRRSHPSKMTEGEGPFGGFSVGNLRDKWKTICQLWRRFYSNWKCTAHKGQLSNVMKRWFWYFFSVGIFPGQSEWVWILLAYLKSPLQKVLGQSFTTKQVNERSHIKTQVAFVTKLW